MAPRLDAAADGIRRRRADGGVGVPAVRRTKLTTPVVFEFQIDKCAAAAEAEARKSLKRKSVAVTAKDVEEASAEGGNAEAEENEPPLKQRRKSAAAE
ncbi:hypothetical protein PRIC1_000345 [Phytophthora ramorum]